MTSKQYHTGFVIGRFQPFHLGHRYLILKSLEYCDQIVIGIGSVNITDDRNPFSADLQKQMVTSFITHEQITARIKKIVTIPDLPDDEEWFHNTQKEIGKVDVVIGNNDWVNTIFKQHSIPAIKVEYYKREIYVGTKIRDRILLGKTWKNRVPEYLIPYIEKEIEVFPSAIKPV